MEWKDVQSQMAIIDQFTEQALNSTETTSENIQVHIALVSKRLDVVDEYIHAECKDDKFLAAFKEYSKHTMKVLKTISKIC